MSIFSSILKLFPPSRPQWVFGREAHLTGHYISENKPAFYELTADGWTKWDHHEEVFLPLPPHKAPWRVYGPVPSDRLPMVVSARRRRSLQ